MATAKGDDSAMRAAHVVERVEVAPGLRILKMSNGAELVERDASRVRGRLKVIRDDMIEIESKAGVAGAVEIVTADGSYHLRLESIQFAGLEHTADRVQIDLVAGDPRRKEDQRELLAILIREIADLREEVARLGGKE